LLAGRDLGPLGGAERVSGEQVLDRHDLQITPVVQVWLESQVKRLLDAPQPVKIILLHGGWETVYSNIKQNSVLGQIASITARGIQVIWLPKDTDWVYFTYRLAVKAEKYCKEK